MLGLICKACFKQTSCLCRFGLMGLIWVSSLQHFVDVGYLLCIDIDYFDYSDYFIMQAELHHSGSQQEVDSVS